LVRCRGDRRVGRHRRHWIILVVLGQIKAMTTTANRRWFRWSLWTLFGTVVAE
jgi:hypothetical protein